MKMNENLDKRTKVEYNSSIKLKRLKSVEKNHNLNLDKQYTT